MIIKNKRGGEKYLSIWWFLMLAVIGVGLVAGVAIFNARTIDTRALEADILAVRVADCLVDNGYLKTGVVEENFDVYENCKINKETIEKSRMYFFSYEVYDAEKCVNNECKIIFEKPAYGVADFKGDCKISQAISAQEYPRCSERKVYTVNKEGKGLLLVVTAGTNNKGGRISGV
ncbi:MAG: hypothetical protein NT076_01840 [Candidatus Pacearchaeota archaeon]|nr:hypothetical protein [Candidatus Pacearchaeota archaeon]